MNGQEKNWARNYTYSTNLVHTPETLEQVQEVVKKCDKLRVLGSRHSFNSIADSDSNLVSLEKLNRVVEIDHDNMTVTVEAGVKYGDLCLILHEQGLAVHNLASLPHISVAGACATGTHGSGDNNGNLATSVSAMELVTADGEVVTLSREKDGEHFNGVVVGLGAVGVVTKVTLDVIPAFDMRQYLYFNLPLAHLEDHFEDIFSSAYSVSLFTDWKDSIFNQVWLKQRVSDGEALSPDSTFYGATPADRDYHPISALSAEPCTKQMGVVGAWYERLPHFRMNFTPSSGEELQTEYFIPREYAFEALQRVNRIREKIAPQLMISEVRTIARDDLWMSPCYQQTNVALHFTWQPRWEAVQPILPLIEEQLAPFNPRPHWGKLFTLPPERVQAQYEKLADFRALLSQYDPQGKFRNAFVEKFIY